MHDEIDAENDDELSGLAQQAADRAIEHHQKLLEQVGLPRSLSVDLARDCWAKERGSRDDDDSDAAAAPDMAQ